MLCCSSCYMTGEQAHPQDKNLPKRWEQTPHNNTTTMFWLLVLKRHLSGWICHTLRADTWCSCRTTKSCSESKATFLLSPWSPLLPPALERKMTGLSMKAKCECSTSLHQQPKKSHCLTSEHTSDQAFVGPHLDPNALPPQHKSTG